MEESIAGCSPALVRALSGFGAGLCAVLAISGAGADRLTAVAIAVMAAVIGYELAGYSDAPRTHSPAPPIDLGAGWTLAGSSHLSPIYLEALRAWCWIADRWDPIWIPKKGGHKRSAVDLRPANAAGTVNRLMATWIAANGGRWTHTQLIDAMSELGLLDRHAAGETFGLSVTPLGAVNERLAVRLRATLQKS
jgi:hypothetical protein